MVFARSRHRDRRRAGEAAAGLASLLRRVRDLDGGIDALAVGEFVFGQLEDGRHIALPLDRAKAILATLVELFHPEESVGGRDDRHLDGRGRRAGRDRGGDRLRWLGGERLRGLAESCAASRGAGDRAACRVARHPARISERRVGLAAIPARIRSRRHPRRRHGPRQDAADARAHSGREARAGRLDRPAWWSARPASCRTGRPKRRASRRTCACWSLHGADRHEPLRRDRRQRSGAHDLRAAAARRRAAAAGALHLVVLDEAHAIKNAAAKATQARLPLDARHRLCLTGHADRESSRRVVVAIRLS